MVAMATDVKTPSALYSVLGGIGDTQQGNINDVYGRIRAGLGKRAMPGGYADSRLNTGLSLSSDGLRSGLEGVLGNTGYSDFKSNRDFGQNMYLTKLAGELMKPSTLQEVLGAFGGAAKTGGQLYGAFGGQRKPYTPSYGLSSPDQFGLNYPSTPDFGYGQTYPNMMRY